MSKYENLWHYIKDCGKDRIMLSFEAIGDISGTLIDHSFLRCKREPEGYGWRVERIFMKERKVTFEKC